MTRKIPSSSAVRVQKCWTMLGEGAKPSKLDMDDKANPGGTDDIGLLRCNPLYWYNKREEEKSQYDSAFGCTSLDTVS